MTVLSRSHILLCYLMNSIPGMMILAPFPQSSPPDASLPLGFPFSPRIRKCHSWGTSTGKNRGCTRRASNSATDYVLPSPCPQEQEPAHRKASDRLPSFKLAEWCYLKSPWGSNERNVPVDSSKVYRFYDPLPQDSTGAVSTEITSKPTTDTLNPLLRKLSKNCRPYLDSLI